MREVAEVTEKFTQRRHEDTKLHGGSQQTTGRLKHEQTMACGPPQADGPQARSVLPSV